MANEAYQGPGTARPVYNVGVVRSPHMDPQPNARATGVLEIAFADLLPNKDIVSGVVAEGFVGDVLTPLTYNSDTGNYEASTYEGGAPQNVDGLLLLATDAFDGPRQINVIKGGNVKGWVGYFKGKDDAAKTAVAEALGGRYDSVRNTIKF